MLRAQAWFHLAGIYRILGSYTEAEPLYQRGLAIFEQLLQAFFDDTLGGY